MLPKNSSINKTQDSTRIETNSIVEYQQHNKSLVAIVIGLAKDKWQLLNETGGEIYIPSTRLALIGKANDLGSSSAKFSFLQSLSNDASQLADTLNLDEVWELVVNEQSVLTENDICEIIFPSPSFAQKLAVRRALLADCVFFKRDKSGLAFEPRRSEIVEELKQKQAVEKAKQEERSQFIKVLQQRLSDPSTPLPALVTHLEKFAALANKAPHTKESLALLEEFSSSTKQITLKGKPEEQAFQLLVATKHFKPDENLALYRCGRSPRFDAEIEDEALRVSEDLPRLIDEDTLEDLTNLLIFSIDAETTQDIDDALSLETTARGYRIGIHITDVASLIAPTSPLFEEALQRATSLYCPDSKVAMLPASLSENALSLIQGEKRRALSFFIEIDSNNTILDRQICHSLIKTAHRLSYAEVEAFLYDETNSVRLHSPALEAALLKLYDISSWFETTRIEAGAMQFSRREMNPVLNSDGRISLEPNTDDTPARKLVSELMILANETAARFARDHGIPFIFRSQEAPENEPATQALDVPEGPAREFLQRAGLKRSVASTDGGIHFGLGLEAYCQITSPIRRASDLVNQQQIISYLKNKTCRFSKEELHTIIAQLEEGLSEAFEIQRERNRYFLLKYIKQQSYTELTGTVMKTDGAKPLLEIDEIFVLWPYEPLANKRLGPYKLSTKPGERVRVKIQRLDPISITLRLCEIG